MYVYSSLRLFIKYHNFFSLECFLSVQKHVKLNEQRASPPESDSQSGVNVTSHQDPQPQVKNSNNPKDVQFQTVSR